MEIDTILYPHYFMSNSFIEDERNKQWIREYEKILEDALNGEWIREDGRMFEDALNEERTREEEKIFEDVINGEWVREGGKILEDVINKELIRDNKILEEALNKEWTEEDEKVLEDALNEEWTSEGDKILEDALNEELTRDDKILEEALNNEWTEEDEKVLEDALNEEWTSEGDKILEDALNEELTRDDKILEEALNNEWAREDDKIIEEALNKEWTREDYKILKDALSTLDDDTPEPNQQEKVVIGGVIKDNKKLQEDVRDIEAGQNLHYIDSSFSLDPNMFVYLPMPGLIGVDTHFEAKSAQNSFYESGQNSTIIQAHTRMVGDHNYGGSRKRSSTDMNFENKRKKVVHWSEEEHKRFLMGLQKCGKGDWRSIARKFVLTRTPTQVASHAQKYYKRQQLDSKRRASIHDITF